MIGNESKVIIKLVGSLILKIMDKNYTPQK